MDERRLKACEDWAQAWAGSSAWLEARMIGELAAEVRRLQAAQQELWADGFAAGEAHADAAHAMKKGEAK